MRTKMDLTSAEMEIMEFLWGREEGILARDLLDEMNALRSKKWKAQTLNTYLIFLYQKGLINRISFERKYLYEARITKEEYKRRLLEDFVESVYGESMFKVISAFVGSDAISQEEAEEIKKMLEDK